MTNVLKRNKEIEFSIDLDLAFETSQRAHMKKLAIDTCASYLARTIAQSEFRIRADGKYIKDELYYRLNVRPNINQTASTFWQDIVYKLIYDNEALVIQADNGDLLVADSFTHKKYAVYEDVFSDVLVRDFTFARTFKQSEVLHLKYANDRLTPLINSLYKDYGELFSRTFEAQKRKNQVRATVTMDATTAKNKNELAKLQDFIDRVYNAVQTKDVAVVPEQPGFEYKEHFSGGGNGILSVDEINKVTGGFFDQVAQALNIPLALIRGDMADVEKVTKNYLLYTIKPLLKKFSDEANAKFIEKKDFLNGHLIEIRSISFNSIFDLANSIDKLRSSGVVNGNEIRAELGLDTVDLPQMEEYFITKNYQEMQSLQGGETNDDND